MFSAYATDYKIYGIHKKVDGVKTMTGATGWLNTTGNYSTLTPAADIPGVPTGYADFPIKLDAGRCVEKWELYQNWTQWYLNSASPLATYSDYVGKSTIRLTHDSKNASTYAGYNNVSGDPGPLLIPSIIWIPYTLAYDANQGTDKAMPAKTDYSYNNSVTVATASVCERTGYTVSAWNTAADGSGLSLTAGATYSDGSSFGVSNYQQSVVLYAQWKANVYTISLVAEDTDDDDYTKSVSVTYDAAPGSIAKLPARAYRKFDGYYTAKNGGGVKYFDADGKPTVETWLQTDVDKLYANFVTYKCTLTFLHDGPGSVSPSGSQEYDSGSVVSVKAIPDTYADFLRWSDGETYETHSDITVSSNATYTAYFGTSTYTLTFTYMNKNYSTVTVSQTYTRGEKIVPPTDYPKITGKNFNWTPAVPEYAYESAAYNGGYQSETYVVTFDGNGADGGSMNSMSFEYESEKQLPKNGFTLTGYSLAGWNTDPNAKVILYADEANLNKNLAESITLYAIWTPNSYTVKFSSGDAKATGEMSDQTFTYDTPQALAPCAFTLAGQDFRGWRSGDDRFTDGQVVSNLTATADGSVALTAVWSEYHYLAFDGNGASGGEMAMMKLDGDEAAALTANTFVRTGYTFAGWTNLIDRVAYTNGETVTIKAASGATNTVYALWDPIVYSVGFDKGDDRAEGEMNDMIDLRFGETYTIDCVFSNDLYSCDGFLGWTNSAAEAGLPDWFPKSSPVSNLTAVAGKRVILTAVWDGVGNLSTAAGLTNGVLRAENGTWGRCWEGCEVDDGSYPMSLTVSGRGTLTFDWSVDSSSMNLTIDGETKATINKSGVMKSVEVTITGEGRHNIVWQPNNVGEACVKNVRWTPTVDPEPTEEDAPSISGVTVSADGTLRISFTADSRFQYELLKTSSLSPAVWCTFDPQLIIVPEEDGEVVFKPAVDATEPAMFYTVEVQKRK